MKRRREIPITTKLTGEEFLLLEDYAIRKGKSRYQMMHDIIVERLESEMGNIDYGIPSEWLPETRERRKRCKPTSIKLQMNFNFYDNEDDDIIDRDDRKSVIFIQVGEAKE